MLAVDAKIGSDQFRFVSVYLPDRSYGENHVQEVYTILQTLRMEAAQEGKYVIIGGDFNAEVGLPDPEDRQELLVGSDFRVKIQEVFC